MYLLSKNTAVTINGEVFRGCPGTNKQMAKRNVAKNALSRLYPNLSCPPQIPVIEEATPVENESIDSIGSGCCGRPICNILRYNVKHKLTCIIG